MKTPSEYASIEEFNPENKNWCWNCQKEIPKGEEVAKYFCSEVCQKTHDDELRQSAEEYESGLKKDKETIEEAKKLLTPSQQKLLDDEIEECAQNGQYGDFKFVDSPEGECYDLNAELKVYIYQTSVGDSGDSFAGVVYFELPNGKWLTWDYST